MQLPLGVSLIDGAYTIIVVTDAATELAETEEANNDGGQAIDLTTTPGPRIIEMAAGSSGGINIGFEASDRHVGDGHGDRTAIRLIRKDGETETFSYQWLASNSARFCNVLADLGVDRGDRVFTLLGRTPALYVAALGVWKRGAVLSPLFSAFGPEPIKSRMMIAEPKALVTTASPSI